jgi:excisionase family DNA binding protein
MTTFTLHEAAAYLKIHPVTLSGKAKSGEIPGAKIGRAWVFLRIDLDEHIRSQYARRALQGEHERSITCHSSNAVIHPIGGSNLRPAVDRAYSEALGLPTR